MEYIKFSGIKYTELLFELEVKLGDADDEGRERWLKVEESI